MGEDKEVNLSDLNLTEKQKEDFALSWIKSKLSQIQESYDNAMNELETIKKVTEEIENKLVSNE